MAYNYDKILAPFARDTAKSKYVDIVKFSRPEFEMLANVKWNWTLKIDGSNVNVIWDGERASYVGHTEKTQFNERTKKFLDETFCTPEAETVFEDLYGKQPVKISMELVSKDMNQNYGYFDGAVFVFDIFNGSTGKVWTSEETLNAFVSKFEGSNVLVAPFIGYMSIWDAVDVARAYEAIWNRHPEKWSEERIVKNPLGPYMIEGLVGRLPYELFNNNGDRVITKVKCKDYDVSSFGSNGELIRQDAEKLLSSNSVY